jgi:hypothetical protein
MASLSGRRDTGAEPRPAMKNLLLERTTVRAKTTPAPPLTREQVAQHEAHHAAVAAFYGFKMTRADANWPEPTLLGRVKFDHAHRTDRRHAPRRGIPR